MEYIPSDYAHLSKVLSKRGTPPPVHIAGGVHRMWAEHDLPNKLPKNNRGQANSGPNSAAVKAIRLGTISSTGSNTSSQIAKPRLEDFKILKVLGQGSFGKVLLAKWKATDKPVAIKALRKDATIENNDVTATIVERDILALGSERKCPFLASLICSFQDPDRLFLVMEFLSGGDLMFHVQKKSRFRTHEARFYACQIACALEYLHNNRIVYRDLKLDNVLLDNDGHCNLADFGMCKKDVSEHNKCATFCGTPDYLAPEIVRGKLYTFSVDWWSFGVLLFEMIMGNSPYYGRTEEELYKNILEKDLKYPSRLDPQARDCLVRLFSRDPTRRLGVTSRVLDHKFFTDVLDVKAVCQRQREPPFIPKRENENNNLTMFFDSEFTKTDIKLSKCEKTPREQEQRFFNDFEYVNDELVTKYITRGSK